MLPYPGRNRFKEQIARYEVVVRWRQAIGAWLAASLIASSAAAYKFYPARCLAHNDAKEQIVVERSHVAGIYELAAKARRTALEDLFIYADGKWYEVGKDPHLVEYGTRVFMDEPAAQAVLGSAREAIIYHFHPVGDEQAHIKQSEQFGFSPDRAARWLSLTRRLPSPEDVYKIGTMIGEYRKRRPELLLRFGIISPQDNYGMASVTYVTLSEQAQKMILAEPVAAVIPANEYFGLFTKLQDAYALGTELREERIARLAAAQADVLLSRDEDLERQLFAHHLLGNSCVSGEGFAEGLQRLRKIPLPPW